MTWPCWGWVRMAPPTPRGQSGQAMAESRGGGWGGAPKLVPNQPRCGSRSSFPHVVDSRSARASPSPSHIGITARLRRFAGKPTELSDPCARYELGDVGRSDVFAEGSGVMPQDCSVAMSQAPEDRARTPHWRVLTQVVLSRRGWRVSRFGKNYVKSTTWTPSKPYGAPFEAQPKLSGHFAPSLAGRLRTARDR